jgi:hypothetical protein
MKAGFSLTITLLFSKVVFAQMNPLTIPIELYMSTRNLGENESVTFFAESQFDFLWDNEYGPDHNHEFFTPSTSIGFTLKADSHVRLAVFDILGREVTKLADGVKGAGQHSAIWNAQTMTSGVYFARLEVADLYGKMLFTKTAKLLLTK